jgi:hypothetical protein
MLFLPAKLTEALLRGYLDLYIRWLTWRGKRPVSASAYIKAVQKSS